MPPTVLVIADHPLAEAAVAWINGRFPRRRIALLAVGTAERPPSAPPGWLPLPLSELLDEAALRRDFLRFLEHWPTQPLRGGMTFDQLFRRRDGYSLWWTGPGAERHPLRGPFPAMRALWLSARAIERERPAEVVLAVRDGRLVPCLASQAERAGIPAHFPPGCALPKRSSGRGRWDWLIGSVLRLARFVPAALARSLAVRLLGGAGAPPAAAPTVVLSALFPQHVRLTDEGGRVWYWEPVVRALADHAPGVGVRHLLRLEWDQLRRRGGWVRALRGLASVSDRLPLPHAQIGLRVLGANLGQQLRLLGRYFCVERLPAFRRSFQFCGADVAGLYVPLLREAVQAAVRWETSVDAAAAALRSAGPVRAAVIHEEFYANAGMVLIAACRRLGIPTVGAQHGTVYPMHLIYTPPPGQLAGAPTPDLFAAYGEFSREVVSRHGAYPAPRVRVVGGPRFDPLVSAPPDRAACRRRLSLPAERFVLLVTTQGQPWFPAAVRALLAAAREAPEACVCIKCWSGDCYRDLYQRWAGEMPADVRVFTDRFDDLLGACDALASVSSTTLLEATLLGRPTLCLNLSGEPDRYPYVEEGVSFPARSEEEIRSAVHRLCRFVPDAAWQERRQRFLERHLGPTVAAGAGAAFAELLAELFSAAPIRRAA
jgi:surface carbohydrate biosynthesis protein (TIGR04326 family)